MNHFPIWSISTVRGQSDSHLEVRNTGALLYTRHAMQYFLSTLINALTAGSHVPTNIHQNHMENPL